MEYGKIINVDCILSDTYTVFQGIPACRKEWNRHRFFPQYGTVGEIHMLNGIVILRVSEVICIPMCSDGVEKISEEEYLKNQFRPDSYNSYVIEGIDYASKRMEQKYSSNFNPDMLESKVNIFYDAFLKAYMVEEQTAQEQIKHTSSNLLICGVNGLAYENDISQMARYIMANMKEERIPIQSDDYLAWFAGIYSKAYSKTASQLYIETKTEKEIFSDLFSVYYQLRDNE